MKTIFRIIAGQRVSDDDIKLCLYSKAFTAFPEKSENDSPMRKKSDSKYNRLICQSRGVLFPILYVYRQFCLWYQNYPVLILKNSGLVANQASNATNPDPDSGCPEKVVAKPAQTGIMLILIQAGFSIKSRPQNPAPLPYLPLYPLQKQA